ncbi:hypothetical protein L209DRAFT_772439 [Thermothelomyces heterothallicus CBS 203.75]
MSSTSTQLPVRPSTRGAQADRPPQSSSPSHDSDSSDDSKYSDLMSESPETPTPAPRCSEPSAQLASEPLSDSAVSPVPAAPSRPVRRRLFPNAPSSGERTRPFLPLRSEPRAAAAADSTAPSSSGWYNPAAFVAEYPPRSRLLPGSVTTPADFWLSRGSWWRSCGCGCLGCGVESVELLSGPRGGTLEEGGAPREGPRPRRQEGFVQWTNPVPESPFVMREGARRAHGRGPFARRSPTPPRPPRPDGPLLPFDGYAVPPSRGWVESTVIDRSNPYAAFLRANREVLAGNASNGAGLSRTGAANGADGETAGMTWDKAHRAAMADPAYLPPTASSISRSNQTILLSTLRYPAALPNSPFSLTKMAQNNSSEITLRKLEPAVARELVENAQSVEYQLLQRKISENARAVAQGSADNKTTVDNVSTVAHLDPDSDEDAFGYSDTDQDDQANGNGHEIPEAADAIAYYPTHGDNNSDQFAQEIVEEAYEGQYYDDHDNASIIRDDPQNGAITPGENGSFGWDVAPTPHIPDVDPIHMYNPFYNPAAAYWSTLPDGPYVDEFGVVTAGRPMVSLHSDPPLPTFDTDPFLPFAPWRVNQLPAFQPETAHRVLTVPAAYLPCLGSLYPDATFLVSRHPASANFTIRLKGAALASSVALHFPHLTDPSRLMTRTRSVAATTTSSNNSNGNNGDDDDDDDDNVDDDNNNNNNVEIDTGDKYVVALVQRDWPVGGVGFLPNTPSAAEFVDALRGAFDVLPAGQEVFYFLSRDVALAGGGGEGGGGEGGGRRTGRGVYVCRAYEGRKGPQDGRIVDAWLRCQGDRGVPQDDLGRDVLARMGEAWVEPDRGSSRAPPPAAAAAAAGAGAAAAAARGRRGGPRRRGVGVEYDEDGDDDNYEG